MTFDRLWHAANSLRQRRLRAEHPGAPRSSRGRPLLSVHRMHCSWVPNFQSISTQRREQRIGVGGRRCAFAVRWIRKRFAFIFTTASLLGLEA